MEGEERERRERRRMESSGEARRRRGAGAGVRCVSLVKLVAVVCVRKTWENVGMRGRGEKGGGWGGGSGDYHVWCYK